jgi:hypothetical protein
MWRNPVLSGTPLNFSFGCTPTLINANSTVPMLAAFHP